MAPAPMKPPAECRTRITPSLPHLSTNGSSSVRIPCVSSAMVSPRGSRFDEVPPLVMVPTWIEGYPAFLSSSTSGPKVAMLSYKPGTMKIPGAMVVVGMAVDE
ncbi:hypothetical protein CCHR01_09939 [Colletotrichum chrysophilum]|uniref:Uncharacterized protein n=1 Tax=Colletotrichum chrysophilum TaxID=1836956 RepID=A0AAD9EGC1_9PEZI|nr:hypothetical protein CCHR01_09939 [Colletotrichum chrysophilum]